MCSDVWTKNAPLPVSGNIYPNRGACGVVQLSRRPWVRAMRRTRASSGQLDNIPILRSRKLRHKGSRVWELVKVKWLVDPDVCIQTADFICTGTVRREVSPPSQGAGRVSWEAALEMPCVGTTLSQRARAHGGWGSLAGSEATSKSPIIKYTLKLLPL